MCFSVCCGIFLFASHKPADTRRGGHVCWQCWTDDGVIMMLAHNSVLLMNSRQNKLNKWIFSFYLHDIFSFSHIHVFVKWNLWTSTSPASPFVDPPSSLRLFGVAPLRRWFEWSWQTTCASWPPSSSCPPCPARCRLPLSGSSSWTFLHWTPRKAGDTIEREADSTWFTLLLLYSKCLCFPKSHLILKSAPVKSDLMMDIYI